MSSSEEQNLGDRKTRSRCTYKCVYESRCCSTSKRCEPINSYLRVATACISGERVTCAQHCLQFGASFRPQMLVHAQNLSQ